MWMLGEQQQSSEVMRSSPLNFVTTFDNVAPRFVPRGRCPACGFQNVTFLEFLVVFMSISLSLLQLRYSVHLSSRQGVLGEIFNKLTNSHGFPRGD